MVTQEEMHELFEYNPITGTIINRRTGRVLYGAMLTVQGAKLTTENCIWVYHYGIWPLEGFIIDHKDHDRSNRKIDNLRLATVSQNGYNRLQPNAIAKGVTYDPTRKKHYRAQIRIDGIKTNLGRFYTAEEAAEAYRQAATEHHGEFACYD